MKSIDPLHPDNKRIIDTMPDNSLMMVSTTDVCKSYVKLEGITPYGLGVLIGSIYRVLRRQEKAFHDYVRNVAPDDAATAMTAEDIERAATQRESLFALGISHGKNGGDSESCIRNTENRNDDGIRPDEQSPPTGRG